MPVVYVHTNIIARDWRRLADFYTEVFDCRPVPPIRDQSGEWLSQGTGVSNASLRGTHLRLPGYGEEGPTLEIYTYGHTIDAPSAPPNQRGFGHLAFRTEDIDALLDKALRRGATKLGELTTCEIQGVGRLTFIYIADPEGNGIELQEWGRKTE